MTNPPSKKLLLIEDDSSLGMRLRKGLQQEGYETSLARTGAEGLSQARQGAFDRFHAHGFIGSKYDVRVCLAVPNVLHTEQVANLGASEGGCTPFVRWGGENPCGSYWLGRISEALKGRKSVTFP